MPLPSDDCERWLGQGGKGEVACQRALTQKRTLWGGGALERGHGAPLSASHSLVMPSAGVGAFGQTIEAAELRCWPSCQGKEECQWALTESNT